MSVSVLISAAQTILTSLIPLATQQIEAAAFDFHDDLASLRRTLTMIQSLLLDAENNRRISSGVMKLWLKNLKLAICDAENLFGEITYEALKSRLEVRKRDKVRSFFSPSNPLAFRPKIANKVKRVNSLLDKVWKEGNDMGLRLMDQTLSVSNAVEASEWRLTHPFVDDSQIVGRKEDVSAVKNMLMAPNVGEEGLPVVAIVGMGGLGKTTLAQLVYNADEVVENFHWRMWICVSDDFRKERILNEMVQSLTREKSKLTNIEASVEKLGKLLNGKKFLLVLDDVWNTSQQKWESMRTSFLGIGGSKGAKILATTRSMDVASVMRVSQSLTHYLNVLSNDECWDLFRKRAFANGGPRETQPLEVVGKRMVRKCKGVPLAISLLGGLLYSKHSVNEWESIEKSNLWQTLDSEDGIRPVLQLSFDHLPSPFLKQCFTYCSIFPKDQTIVKDEVIQLWMGLGYLQPSSGSNLEMEDVGNEYFDILSRNSLFQEVKLDPLNNVQTCKMHDLVHDLALDLSDGNCLTLNASEVKDHPEVQHLSLWVNRGSRIQFSKENIGKLRTLFLRGYFPQNMREIKCVRALSLEGDAEDLQSSLRKFIHLRYLHLSKTYNVKLPNDVTCLYNLQTLRLSPSAKLVEIPKEFHKMVSLRHLCIADTEENRKVMPKMVGHLTSLQTLPFFVVSEDKGHKIEELGSLTKLRGRLHVYDLQHVKDKEEAEQAQMHGKSGITELGFHWNQDSGNSTVDHEGVLEGLKPHSNLRGLKLENFGGSRLASWMRSRATSLLQNLVKIELRHCRLCEQLPALGHLPHLQVVEMDGLDGLKRIGLEFYGLDEGICYGSSCSSGAGGGVFPALRILTLSNMLGLEEWSELSSSPAAAASMNELFPCLEKLSIRNCPQLIRIIALWHIPRLKIVELDGLDNLMHIGPDNLVLDRGVALDRSSISGAGRVVVFPALRNLIICNTPKVEAWSELSSLPFAAVNIRFFPKLENLYAKNCPQLFSMLSCSLSYRDVSLLSVDSSYGNFEMRYTPYVTSLVVDPDFKRIILFLEDFLEKSSKSLTELKIKGLNELCYFPNRLLNLALLSRLEIRDCSNLKSLPNPNMPSLPVATTSMKQVVPCLKRLHIWNCPQLTTIPDYMLAVQNLAVLSVHASYGDFEMKDSLSLTIIGVDPGSKNTAMLLDDLLEKSSKSVRNLLVKGLDELHYFPNQLLNLSSLERFEICDCPNLMYILEATEAGIFNSLTSLRQILILRCSRLRYLPKELLKSTLVTLEMLWCPDLDMPDPDEFRSLTTLHNLSVAGCPKWVSSWEEGFLCLTSLKKLEIGKFSKELDYFPWPTKSVGLLESLSLWGWPKFKYLPEGLQGLNALIELELYSWDGLEALPEWLGNFSSLQSLTLQCCQNLMRLPSREAIQRLTNLQSLTIESCPLLWERCLKSEKSEEFCKIIHLPYIKFKKCTLVSGSAKLICGGNKTTMRLRV